jgi:hypothetical protein
MPTLSLFALKYFALLTAMVRDGHVEHACMVSYDTIECFTVYAVEGVPRMAETFGVLFERKSSHDSRSGNRRSEVDKDQLARQVCSITALHRYRNLSR